MKSELNSLEKHETWQLVPRPPDRKPVGTKWVYKLKISPDAPPRYKARLVAKGYSQIPGLDYTETFAPVVKATSVRILLSLATSQGLLIYQFDVETAFLNGKLTENIYVEQPPGFTSSEFPDYVFKLNKALYGLKQASHQWANEFKSMMINLEFTQSTADDSIFVSSTDPIIIVAIYVDQPPGFISTEYPNHVLKLNRALYGLKQASHQWANEFKSTMINLEFTQSTADDSIFVSSTDPIIIVAIYVDDILVLAKHQQEIDDIFSSLDKVFNIRSLGPVKLFLGLNISRPTLDRIFLSQTSYIERILEKFGMSTCNPAKSPLESSNIVH